VKVLDTWARADAETLTGRVIYADLMLDARQFPLAEAALDGLLTDYPDEADVLGLYLRLAGATGRQQQAIDRLEQLRLRDPTNGAVIQALVAAHRQRGETPAALRVLERSAEAASRQPNLLYQIASLYFLMEQKDLSQTLLERVLSVDSTHVAASNDLAYYWSDAGANLERSEALARQAVASEPDNSAYLDTLGWVLYKRGRFEEARKYLLQAVDVAPEPDPEVLDHLADASYRMGDYAEAASRWQQAAAILRNPGVITDRPDRAELRLRVDGKIRQRLAGEEVDVARLGSAEDS
jgi:tetratricopeptide (TPR) repeat protein